MAGKKSKKANKDSGKGKKYLFEEVLKAFQKEPGKLLNYKQLAHALDITDASTRVLLNAVLDELTTRDMLIQPERGKYKLKPNNRYTSGRIEFTQNGSAFVMSQDTERDIYINPKYAGAALDGDIVKVYLFPMRKPNARPEGEVVEILQRKKTEFVGNIKLNKGFAFVVPDSNKIDVDFFVPQDKILGAQDGQKVVVKLTHWDNGQPNPSGEVIKVLGTPGENETEIHAILEEFGLPYEFPTEVEHESHSLPTEITEEEVAKRRDFRKVTTFTIDPFDAKDFDDALSYRKLDNGNIEVGVHIADVTHYLTPGTRLDDEAFARATSVYLVDRVVPMLPEVLSNGVCSLRPNEDKLTFSAVFELNENAEIINEWFGKTVIHSIRRFTYEEAQEVIETGKGDLATEVLELDRLAKIMRKARFKNGSIGFEKEEVKFKLDDKGKPLGVYFKVTKDSNHLIEEFMLLANKRVAEFVGKPKMKKGEKQPEERTFVYRIHDTPNDEKLDSFLVLVRKLGYQFNSGSPQSVAKSMNKLMEDTKERPERNMIEQLAIRTMAKAVYSTDNIGHYGLSFDFYSHFTSPIRRYPDVMVHRLLQYYLDGGKSVDKDEYEELCEHCSEREKVASDAERASIKFKQVEFMKERIGAMFKGIITGVTDFGLFVEIESNKCEGLVRMKDMPNDWYDYDEENYCLIGSRTGKKYSLGDEVMVEVKTADIYKKQLDFLLVNGDKF